MIRVAISYWLTNFSIPETIWYPVWSFFPENIHPLDHHLYKLTECHSFSNLCNRTRMKRLFEMKYVMDIPRWETTYWTMLLVVFTATRTTRHKVGNRLRDHISVFQTQGTALEAPLWTVGPAHWLQEITIFNSGRPITTGIFGSIKINFLKKGSSFHVNNSSPLFRIIIFKLLAASRTVNASFKYKKYSLVTPPKKFIFHLPLHSLQTAPLLNIKKHFQGEKHYFTSNSIKQPAY